MEPIYAEPLRRSSPEADARLGEMFRDIVLEVIRADEDADDPSAPRSTDNEELGILLRIFLRSAFNVKAVK